MALGAKIFGIFAVVGGGGIATTMYLKSRGGNESTLKAQVQVPQTTHNTPNAQDRVVRNTRSVEQVSCNVSDVSSKNQDLESSLREKKKHSIPYSLVSCVNPFTEDKGEDTYFGNKWEGLFPTSVLSDKLYYQTEEKFALNVTTVKITDDRTGNDITYTDFSNLKTSSSIRSRLTDIDDINFPKKKAAIFEIQGISQELNKVYILLEKTE